MINPKDAAAFLDICTHLLEGFSPALARSLCLAFPSGGGDGPSSAAELLAGLAEDRKKQLSGGQRAELRGCAELLEEAEQRRESTGIAAVLELLAPRLPAGKSGGKSGGDQTSGPSLAQLGILAAECGGDMREFLRRVELNIHESEGAYRPERVSVLTFHAAKGLEFPVVFIAGAEETITPITSPGADPEEERRLFYVALTRARERVIITRSRTRRLYGRRRQMQPSRFLAEIPASCMQGGGGQKIASRRGEDQLSLFT
jgi:superfamily I DNA/RNA helicase